ncbi:MAG: EamA family transporter RarD, partial [Limnobacter sp.]
MQKGIFLSILASVLFGTMYYYTTLLEPLNGEEIYGWRMLLTLPVMTLFLIFTNDWGLIKSIVLRLKTEW